MAAAIGLFYDIATAQVLKVDSTRFAMFEGPEYLTGRG
jgi:hypothetical protein